MIELYEGEPKPRTKRVATNLTDNEYRVILLRMEELSLRKTATFLRLMALGERQYPVLNVSPVNVELAELLQRTTSNLNQIARHLNENPSSWDNLRRAFDERESLAVLLRRTINLIQGHLDYGTMARFATEMLRIDDLERAIRERKVRHLP